MLSELHWGGINGKSLIKAVLTDIWMVFAVMVITYLGLGIVGNMRYTPTYISSTVVAVYPFNKMSTLEASSDALETVGAVNEVLNSEMFITGLKDRMAEPVEFSLYSEQITGTYILMISASSSTPDNAYQILRASLDYFQEMSTHLVGNTHLEILTEPDFPTTAIKPTGILSRRTLLTLLTGFAMGCFLILMYVIRKTYKTPAAIRRVYRDVLFFRVGSDKGSKNKGKPGKAANQETMRKTALILLQMLRARKSSSIFVTSAAQNESKTDITISLARKMADYGKSVLIIETDPENAEIEDQDIKVIYANKMNDQDDFLYMAKEVEEALGQAKELADVILIDGCVWTGSREELNWKKAADTSLAICMQDKADFYAIDRMMTDLQKDNSDFLGCVLYGF